MSIKDDLLSIDSISAILSFYVVPAFNMTEESFSCSRDIGVFSLKIISTKDDQNTFSA